MRSIIKTIASACFGMLLSAAVHAAETLSTEELFEG